jgi:hypothetical protein
LISILIPSSAVVLAQSTFTGCSSLTSILLERGSFRDWISDSIPANSQLEWPSVFSWEELNPFGGEGHSGGCSANRRERVNSHGLPPSAVAMIRSEFRRHQAEISQTDLDRQMRDFLRFWKVTAPSEFQMEQFQWNKTKQKWRKGQKTIKECRRSNGREMTNLEGNKSD